MNPSPAPPDRHALMEATSQLADFMDELPLTDRIASVEQDLVGKAGADVLALLEGREMTDDLLRSTLVVRQAFGRISDIIHATVILAVLAKILEDGEKIEVRPSLASGVGPHQEFDLETSSRVAEFKVAVWRGSGGNVARQRTTFADFARLVLADGSRTRELYVVGPRPLEFLETSTQSVEWALRTAPLSLRDRFSERYDMSTSVRDFRQGDGAAVRVHDLTGIVPELEQFHV
ncbi:hypothetical protein [Ornithinimicrobium sp. W1665]|uniref:hypothetical protein n=1 Tax=Ornithinimicrobium sp. W1665 TaxID=3416666 RepID=UPI003CEBE738